MLHYTAALFKQPRQWCALDFSLRTRVVQSCELILTKSILPRSPVYDVVPSFSHNRPHFCSKSHNPQTPWPDPNMKMRKTKHALVAHHAIRISPRCVASIINPHANLPTSMAKAPKAKRTPHPPSPQPFLTLPSSGTIKRPDTVFVLLCVNAPLDYIAPALNPRCE